MIYGDRTKEHRNQHGRDAKGIKKPPKTRRLDKDKYGGLNGCYAFFGRIYSIKIIDVNNIGSITLTLAQGSQGQYNPIGNNDSRDFTIRLMNSTVKVDKVELLSVNETNRSWY